VANKHARNIERRMKSTHMWRNRTGEAERQLFCEATLEGGTITLVAGHGVPYGERLERDPRFAIVDFTVKREWSDLVKAWGEVIERAGE
jgi:delta 1-pyrroline-5-carboxylate dehydrogenase